MLLLTIVRLVLFFVSLVGDTAGVEQGNKEREW